MCFNLVIFLRTFSLWSSLRVAIHQPFEQQVSGEEIVVVFRLIDKVMGFVAIFFLMSNKAMEQSNAINIHHLESGGFS